MLRTFIIAERFALLLVGVLLFSCGAGIAEDAPPAELLSNPTFKGTPREGKSPNIAAWKIRGDAQQISVDADAGHATAKQALRVDIKKDAGKNYGEIVQSLKLKKWTKFRLRADLKGSKEGVGFVQLKLLQGGKELKRLATGWNTKTWAAVERAFESEDADEAQVLCRYRQNEHAVGQTVWFTALSVVSEGETAKAAEMRAAVAENLKAARVPGLASTDIQLIVAPAGTDQYVLPEGAGDQSGADWANARAAGDGGLQAAWDACGPGQTVHLGSGTYPGLSLTITNGGDHAARRKTLAGIDTGAGLPVCTSNFVKENPAKTGKRFLSAAAKTGYWEVRDLVLRDYREGLILHGRHRGVRITNVDIERARDGMVLNGGATTEEPFAGTYDVIIRDCDFKHYTKRAIRIRDGNSGVRIINCHGDAGGRAWATERFAIGFPISGGAQGVFDHDITFVNCTARNHWDPHGDQYWNADGFTAERNCYNITYVNCGAFDNTDGGWDVKSKNTVWINCVALRNKRNFRIWSKPGPAHLINCVAAFAHKYGGSGNAIGIHPNRGAYVIAEGCTLYNNGDEVDVTGEAEGPNADTMIELHHCVVVNTTGGRLKGVHEGGHFLAKDTVFYRPLTEKDKAANAQLAEGATPVATVGEDPQLVAPDAKWEGGSDAFVSKKFPGKGYQVPGQAKK